MGGPRPGSTGPNGKDGTGEINKQNVIFFYLEHEIEVIKRPAVSDKNIGNVTHQFLLQRGSTNSLSTASTAC